MKLGYQDSVTLTIKYISVLFPFSVQHHVTECQKDPIRGCHVHQLLFFPLLNLITSSDPFGEATDNIQRHTATILGELEIALATKRLQEAGDGITSIWVSQSFTISIMEKIVHLNVSVFVSLTDKILSFVSGTCLH